MIKGRSSLFFSLVLLLGCGPRIYRADDDSRGERAPEYDSCVKSSSHNATMAIMTDEFTGETFSLEVMSPRPFELFFDERIPCMLSYEIRQHWLICVNYDTTSPSSSPTCSPNRKLEFVEPSSDHLLPGEHVFSVWVQPNPQHSCEDGEPRRFLEVTIPYLTYRTFAATMSSGSLAQSLEHLSNRKWDRFVSLGSDCCGASSLQELGLRDVAFPFDFTNSNPTIIHQVLRNGWEEAANLEFSQHVGTDSGGMWDFMDGCMKLDQIPDARKHTNKFGQGFAHYSNVSHEEMNSKLSRRFQRFTALLNGHQSVLFIKTAREYAYSQVVRSRAKVFYEDLISISMHILKYYPHLDFHILNFEHDNIHQDTDLITNVEMNVDELQLTYSDDCEGIHCWSIGRWHQVFQRQVTDLIRQIFIPLGIENKATCTAPAKSSQVITPHTNTR